MSKQFLLFLLTGGIATLIQYLLFWIGVDFFIWPASLSSGIGYLTGAMVSYILNYYMTFESCESHRQTVSKFTLMVATGWLITFVMIGLLVDLMLLDKWLSQFFVTIVVIAWNYNASRLWVFTKRYK